MYRLDPRPFDRLRAVSRFDKLTTLSWPKGLPNGLRGDDQVEIVDRKEKGDSWPM
jgi:hypothetical protein